MASYAWAAVKPKGREDTFEQWVSNRFGKRLYQHFFKTYTEKLWGVSATEIRAEWAAQRIKGLSFFSAAKAAFFGNQDNIKSLISEFNYPRFGPGQMWEQMASDIKERGGEIRLNAPVTKLVMSEGRVTEVIAGGETLRPSHVISSLPLRTTVGIATPEAPLAVRDAAQGLRYREFLTVLLVIDVDDPFDDNWIYIHQPGVKVLRIQNFKSWSPFMIPEGETASSIGMEYFCFEGDDFWNSSDEDLVKMAGQEIEKLKLAPADKVRFGFVERVHKAYPIYDENYAERVQTIRDWLVTISNIQQVGRNGLHRYNNSDHSMLTAMRAVDNVMLGRHEHDLWSVNVESVYHEEVHDSENPYKNDQDTPAMKQPLASER